MQVHHLDRRAVEQVDQPPARHLDLGRQRRIDGDGDHPPPGPTQLGRERPARRVVDADHRHVRRRLAGEDPALRRNIALEVAVPVEMIGGEVQPDGNPAMQVRAQVELVGGELEHEDAVLRPEFEIEDRPTDIAADHRVGAGGDEEMVDQRCRRRLAVGAGHADQGSRPEQLGKEIDVAANRHVRGTRRNDQRMGQRHAGARHEQGEPPDLLRSTGPHARAAASASCLSSKPSTSAPAAMKARAAARPLAASPRMPTCLPLIALEPCRHGLTAASRWRGRPAPGSWR